MATFLPNVTDVFAGSSDFDPDFNRIERMLSRRESMYEQGAKRVKNLYDSVFNSPMLRDSDIQKRDTYLKTITDGLNRVSSMDLSLPENQQMATDLFIPVTTDQSMIKDIAWTKSYQAEAGRAQQLRTSTDSETRKQYWDIGMKSLQYQAEEFSKADDNTALTMGTPRYVPKVDMLSLAEKAYKESGISVKEDQVNGGYIFTKKNGEAVYPITKSYVNTLFQQDPGIQDMLRTQAYVNRKDFIKENATKYGGENQAAVAYIQDAFNIAGTAYANGIKVDEKEVAGLQDKVDSWNKYIKDKGIIPDKDNPEYQQYLHDVQSLETAKQGVQNQKANLTDLKLPSKIDNSNFNTLLSQADNIVANYNLGNFTNEIAKLLAFKNAELTVKADPIYLTKLRSDLSLKVQSIMEGIRHANSVALENSKFAHQKELQDERIAAGEFSNKGKATTGTNTNQPNNTFIPGPLTADELKNQSSSYNPNSFIFPGLTNTGNDSENIITTSDPNAEINPLNQVVTTTAPPPTMDIEDNPYLGMGTAL